VEGAVMNARFSRIDADLLLLKWMTGFMLAGVTGLVLRAFFA
jgi:hypothetical protein